MAKTNNLSFTKMSGGGNDFVLVDNRDGSISSDSYAALAAKVCQRKFSIGADGLLVVEKSNDADFRMAYYNADGSRAEMCGNGARCIARFAHLLKAVPVKMNFMTDAGLIGAEVLKDGNVRIKMSEPRDLRLDFHLRLNDEKGFNISSLNTGVPHAALIVTETEKVDVDNLGRTIRNHKEFQPAGTNVNFVMPKDKQTLVVRTYERGVEGETLACGTGVVASSLIAAAKNLVSSPVSVVTRGGDTLTVSFSMKKESEGTKDEKVSFKDVYLEGPAVVCFRGEVEF